MGVRDYLMKFIKRRTPVPLEKDVFNLGIQERRHPQHILGPVLYNVANQSTVVRTCITQLKTEIFRYWLTICLKLYSFSKPLMDVHFHLPSKTFTIVFDISI